MALRGIDISSYQSGIDLAKVDADFVIVKATQGQWYPDMGTTKATNLYINERARMISQTLSAGKLLGLYHYAEGTDYKKEADFFLSKVQDFIGKAVLALDWEQTDNQSFSQNPHWCKQWLDYVYNVTGVKPLLYIQASILPSFQEIGDYGLWVAQYANQNITGYQEHPWNEGSYLCAIRQYTDAGRIHGYSYNLDLNKFYGDIKAWEKYAMASKNSQWTVVDLATAVINGEYGNGEERKIKLGSQYSQVQEEVDHRLGASVSVLAREVINGKYGNGEARRKALGTRYEEVQKAVNQMLQ